MTGNQANISQQEPLTPREPFDDVQDVYIGHVYEAIGSLQMDGIARPARFWGEVIFQGHVAGDTTVIERVRRAAVCGTLIEPDAQDSIGVFSLTSLPVEITPVSQSGRSVTDLHLQLHYAALSIERPPLYESDDAIFPETEQIMATLTLEPVEQLDKPELRLEVKLVAHELVDKKLGFLQGIVLDPIVIPFRLANGETPRQAMHHSLSPRCPPPASGPCGPGLTTRTRQLPIKFVNFSKKFDLSIAADRSVLETMCQAQLDGVCEIWRNKAALDLVVQAEISEGTSVEKDAFCKISMSDSSQLDRSNHNTVSEVEIYLVDQLVNWVLNGKKVTGGGVTLNSGQASACCILEVGRMTTVGSDPQRNPYLLAHELGHVLGLDHPDGPVKSAGSANSIMKPATPNPNINTFHNCRIFMHIADVAPLNCRVTDIDPPQVDCFRPDPG